MNSSAIFEWNEIDPELWHLVYSDYTIKLVCNPKNSKEMDCKKVNFGSAMDIDYNQYEGREIVFKMPAEHTING